MRISLCPKRKEKKNPDDKNNKKTLSTLVLAVWTCTWPPESYDLF